MKDVYFRITNSNRAFPKDPSVSSTDWCGIHKRKKRTSRKLASGADIRAYSNPTCNMCDYEKLLESRRNPSETEDTHAR